MHDNRSQVAMIDTGLGNVGSVHAAFERAGVEVAMVDCVEGVEAAAALILPGVGAFGDGMASLEHKRLVEPIRRHVAAGRPLLGICLGMQLLADHSDEYGSHAGLGIVPGKVVRLAPAPASRVPNMGWCPTTFHLRNPLFEGLQDGESFYFAHSYHFRPDDPRVVSAFIPRGDGRIVAAIQKGNVYGVQFHPEKSQDPGLRVVAAWAQRALPTAGVGVAR